MALILGLVGTEKVTICKASQLVMQRYDMVIGYRLRSESDGNNRSNAAIHSGEVMFSVWVIFVHQSFFYTLDYKI